LKGGFLALTTLCRGGRTDRENGLMALAGARPGWNNQILLHWIYLPAPKPAAERFFWSSRRRQYRAKWI
jgi:hypothetical protein